MSLWTTPATWTNGAVTAAQMNAEIRDRAVWLKAALDLITGGTISDTGTSTRLRITRPSIINHALAANVAGDASDRFWITANGTLQWGDGTGGSDIRLLRDSFNILRVDDAQFRVERVAETNPAFVARVAGDNNTKWVVYGNGLMDMREQSSAVNFPPSSYARIYARDNGGKTELVVQFPTGAVQQLAIQP